VEPGECRAETGVAEGAFFAPALACASDHQLVCPASSKRHDTYPQRSDSVLCVDRHRDRLRHRLSRRNPWSARPVTIPLAPYNTPSTRLPFVTNEGVTGNRSIADAPANKGFSALNVIPSFGKL
jgi:hypothetical protein